MTIAHSMTGLRTKNVAAFVAAFCEVEHRSATIDDICIGMRLTQAEARVALRKLEAQGAVRHVVTFEPTHVEPLPVP